MTNKPGNDQIPTSRVWEQRFHRPWGKTNGWMFYISRPTLEMLRKPGKEGKLVHDTLKQAVEKFLSPEGPGYTPASAYRSDQFTVKTEAFDIEKQKSYATISFPFDIRDEVKHKLGVILHVGIPRHEKDAIAKTLLVDLEEENKFPSMFDGDFRERIISKLDDLNKNSKQTNQNKHLEFDFLYWRFH